MAQTTDPRRAPVDARDVLTLTADHLTKTHPTGALDDTALLIGIGAAAYELTGRLTAGGGQALARAAARLAPPVPAGITRGEYALILRRVLAEAGHDWPDGDDDRVIPRITGIPGPRTEPTPVDTPRQHPEQPEGGVA